MAARAGIVGRSFDSEDEARSVELIGRWIAGDDAALEEWMRGVEGDPAAQQDPVVAAARTLLRALDRPEPGPSREDDVARRGGARYKYPGEGR